MENLLLSQRENEVAAELTWIAQIQQHVNGMHLPCRSHHHAATRLDSLTGEPARRVAHEERDYVGNVFRFPQSPEWRHLCAGLPK
jgi:hypothetical protein